MKGDAEDELVAALIARAGDGARLMAARRRGWASCTFEGEWHAIALSMPAAACAAFADRIDEAEFALEGHFVASIAIIDTQVDEAVDGIRATIVLEALTMLVA